MFTIFFQKHFLRINWLLNYTYILFLKFIHVEDIVVAQELYPLQNRQGFPFIARRGQFEGQSKNAWVLCDLLDQMGMICFWNFRNRNPQESRGHVGEIFTIKFCIGQNDKIWEQCEASVTQANTMRFYILSHQITYPQSSRSAL